MFISCYFRFLHLHTVSPVLNSPRQLCTKREIIRERIHWVINSRANKAAKINLGEYFPAHCKCLRYTNQINSFFHVECDPVDIIPDIIPINMSRLVGIRRSLRCSTQPYPSRQRVRCDTDGQWIRQYDTCSE